MAANWPVVTFAEAPFEIIDGDRGTNYPKQADFCSIGPCLFLNAGNVTSTGFNFTDRAFITEEKDQALRKGKLQRQDLVLTTRGTVGNAAYFDTTVPFDHMRINSGMVILRPVVSKILPRFLYLFLRSKVFQSQVEFLRTGSAQPQLPIRDINRIELPLPPLSEQRAIAHILGTLDDKIELNRRMNETLEAMARAIFKSWFVDFDPVHAKKAGRQPTGMDPATAALFPSEFQPSPLGPLPRGWHAGQLVDVARQVRDGVKPHEVPPEMPYIGLEHMPQRSLALESWGEASDAQSQKSRFRKGQILFGKLRPYFHKVGVAPVDGLCSTDIVVVEPIDPAYSSFCLGHASSDSFVAYTNAGSDGTRMPRTSWKQMAAYALSIPPASIATAFRSFTEPLIDRIHANLFESRTLAKTRNALLPRLLSGELSVTQIGQVLEATA